MGRAGRQRSSQWPKRTNTQAKNMLRLNKKNSLKGVSHLQELMMPHHSCYTTYSRVADILGSPQHRPSRWFEVWDETQKSFWQEKKMRTCAMHHIFPHFAWHMYAIIFLMLAHTLAVYISQKSFVKNHDGAIARSDSLLYQRAATQQGNFIKCQNAASEDIHSVCVTHCWSVKLAVAKHDAALLPSVFYFSCLCFVWQRFNCQTI